MESNSTKIILFLIAFSLVTAFFNCIGLIPKKNNFFTYKLTYQNGKPFSDLVFWKAILYLLLTLLIYQFLKYLRWRRKYRFENQLNYFLSRRKVIKQCQIQPCFICKIFSANNIWKKYLGYTKRDEDTEFIDNCKKGSNA